MEDFMALWKDMVYPVEPKLDGDFCESAFISELVISIIIGANSSAIDWKQQWDVLAKQREFWKARSRNATIWAFFAPNSSSSSNGSSSTPQFEQLKCVFCILLGSVGFKKGIITYKLDNEWDFFPSKNILNLFTIDCGVSGLCRRRKDQNVSNCLQKTGLAPLAPPFLIFLVMLHHIPRMIQSKKDLKRI